MNTRIEGTIGIIAALLVLFSAMWDVRISLAVSVAALVMFSAYHFTQMDKS